MKKLTNNLPSLLACIDQFVDAKIKADGYRPEYAFSTKDRIEARRKELVKAKRQLRCRLEKL